MTTSNNNSEQFETEELDEYPDAYDGPHLLDDLERVLLTHYLTLLTWSAREAFCLFRSLDPRTTELVWPLTLDEPTDAVKLIYYQTRGSRELTTAMDTRQWVRRTFPIDQRLPEWPFPEEQEDLFFEEERLEMFRQMWLTEPKPKTGRCKPQEFIDWAYSRNISVPWLDWAIQGRLCKDPALNPKRNLSGLDDLESSEGEMALAIMASLLKSGYGMDIYGARRNKFDDVLRDLMDNGVSISSKTLRTWILDAGVALKRVESKQAAKPRKTVK